MFGKFGNGLYSAASAAISSNEVPILTGSRTGSFAASAWFKATGVNLSTARIFQSDGEDSDLLLYLDFVYLNGAEVASVSVAGLPGEFGNPYGDFGVQAQTEAVTDDVAVWVGSVPTPAGIAAIAAAAGDLSTLI